MTTVRACEIPSNSLLRKYQYGIGFADCYAIDVRGHVSQAAYVEAFYTTPLFKIERTLLTHLASRPASDADARQLANGLVNRFSAWRVEDQSPSELLLADFTGRTRSWLMAAPVDELVQGSGTRLYFGSAVVPRTRDGSGKGDLGWPFKALLGFHELYSRLLLRAASRKARFS